MKAVSIRTLAAAVSIFLTSFSVCSAAEAPAQKILTSFVSCQVSNAVLDKAGIPGKMLHDANSNPMVAAKVFSLLHEPNSVTLFANPKLLTIDGEAARMEAANIKIDLTASIQENSLINVKIDWQKRDSNSPGIGSVNTQIQLHSGEPAVVSFSRLNGHTLFLIVKSEILDPNKPVDSHNSQRLDKFVIEPLMGMGKLHFSMTREEMIKILGQPQGTNGPNINDYTKFGFTVVTRVGLVWGIFCGDKSRPDSDLIKNCRCKTTKGIGMGSTKQEIIAAYGEPTKTVADNGLSVMLYKNIAMTFSLRDDKVVYMGAQWPPEPKNKTKID